MWARLSAWASRPPHLPEADGLGGATITIDFADFGAQFHAPAPPPEQLIDREDPFAHDWTDRSWVASLAVNAR